MPTFPLPSHPSLPYKTGIYSFGWPQTGGRKHAGCDLIAASGAPVYAIAKGTVVQPAYHFVVGNFSEIFALEVDHGTYLVRYGQIGAMVHGLTPGIDLSEGQVIGYMSGFRTENGLHIEMYSKQATGPLTVPTNPPYLRRSDLVDPTPLLDIAKLR